MTLSLLLATLSSFLLVTGHSHAPPTSPAPDIAPLPIPDWPGNPPTPLPPVVEMGCFQFWDIACFIGAPPNVCAGGCYVDEVQLRIRCNMGDSGVASNNNVARYAGPITDPDSIPEGTVVGRKHNPNPWAMTNCGSSLVCGCELAGGGEGLVCVTTGATPIRVPYYEFLLEDPQMPCLPEDIEEWNDF